jgi:hypothetical protein
MVERRTTAVARASELPTPQHQPDGILCKGQRDCQASKSASDVPNCNAVRQTATCQALQDHVGVTKIGVHRVPSSCPRRGI